MSIRTKSNPKLKKFPQSNSKKFETLQESLKKYEARLWKKPQEATSPPLKKHSKQSTIKSVRSHASPFTKYSSKHKNSSLLSSSETSIETYAKLSMFENSSDARTVGSPVTKSNKEIRHESLDYEAELDKCRRQNLDLQAKIESLQRKSMKSEARKQSGNFTKDLLKDSDFSEEKQSPSKEEIEREFEAKHDQIMKAVKNKHQKQLKDLEESLTTRFQAEIQDLQASHEQKTSKKLTELTTDYERKLSRAQEEVSWLRKQNDKLKRNLEEASSRLDSAKPSDGLSNSAIDLKKQLKDLQAQFLQLQHDYVHAKKEGSGLCSKCKAFTETNNELSSKIHRIRAFIDSNQ